MLGCGQNTTQKERSSIWHIKNVIGNAVVALVTIHIATSATYVVAVTVATAVNPLRVEWNLTKKIATLNH